MMPCRWLPPRGEQGAALATAMLAMFLISLTLVMMLRQADALGQETSRRSSDDQLITHVEAILDRYGSKLVRDPLYAHHWVDEFEAPRTCISSDPVKNGVTVQPGNAWVAGCADWDYSTATPESLFRSHPLLEDLDAALMVDPTPLEGAELTVVGRAGDSDYRAVRVSMGALSLSEFVRVTQSDLSYGTGAQVRGKIYSGGTLDFASSTSVNKNFYSEDGILSPPTNILDNADGYDSSGNWLDIREDLPQPLNFDNFWDDLSDVRLLACDGGGICLNDPSVSAYLVHPRMVGTEMRINVWSSGSHSGSSGGCQFTTESWWWRRPHEASVVWTPVLVDSPGPQNGLLWSSAHIVLGSRDAGHPGSGMVEVKGGLTIYAGSSVDPKNVVLNSDTAYYDPQSSSDVMGIMASDEVIINPDAMGADDKLDISGALLAQGDPGLRTVRDCGDTGASLPANNNEFTLNGALATRQTAWMAQAWWPRTYGFDERLEYLAPPHYPRLSDDWQLRDWEETTIPSWAKQ